MDSNEEKRILRTALALGYPDAESARGLARRAGLTVARIDFSGSAETFWFHILEEADKSNRITSLMNETVKDYVAGRLPNK